jgi:hypothetical protein
LHFGLKYEIIYQLDAIEYLCSFSSTCFGLKRPSSGAMDVTVSLDMQQEWTNDSGVNPWKTVFMTV